MKKIIKENGRTRVVTAFTEPSKTQQQFKKDCDVNVIIKKYRQGHAITHISKHEGGYGDFTEISSYQDALDKVITLNQEFSRLPSEIRTRFNNDPGRLIDFINDERNTDEAIRLGLLEKRLQTELDNTNVKTQVTSESITAPKKQGEPNAK